MEIITNTCELSRILFLAINDMREHLKVKRQSRCFVDRALRSTDLKKNKIISFTVRQNTFLFLFFFAKEVSWSFILWLCVDCPHFHFVSFFRTFLRSPPQYLWTQTLQLTIAKWTVNAFLYWIFAMCGCSRSLSDTTSTNHEEILQNKSEEAAH